MVVVIESENGYEAQLRLEAVVGPTMLEVAFIGEPWEVQPRRDPEWHPIERPSSEPEFDTLGCIDQRPDPC